MTSLLDSENRLKEHIHRGVFPWQLQNPSASENFLILPGDHIFNPVVHQNYAEDNYWKSRSDVRAAQAYLDGRVGLREFDVTTVIQDDDIFVNAKSTPRIC